MTKRTGESTNIKSKKIKIDDNLDDLWGEDPNVDDVDDCLLLATQACEQNVGNCTQLNNVSILPNYSLFKEDDRHLFASTQKAPNENNFEASSSNFLKPYNNCHIKTTFNGNSYQHHSDIKDLEQEVQDLRDKYESKGGEVSILRSQLKETKTTLETEYHRKEKEWLDKMHISTKEINSIKSELEFKNLELVNLKNKLQEVYKVYVTDNGLNNSVLTDNQFNIAPNTIVNYKIEPYLDIKYPLIENISPAIFKFGQMESFYNFKRDSSIMKEHEVNNTLLENVQNKHHNFNDVLSDISVLTTSDIHHINSEVCSHHINNIVSTSHVILYDFYTYLSNVEFNNLKQNSEQVYDNQNLSTALFDSGAIHNKEVGIRARQTVAVLSEIFPYSSHLQTTFLNSIERNRSCNNYLQLILMIVTLIRIKKMGDNCQGFLCAVAMFMYRISQTEKFNKCYAFVLNVVKELVFVASPILSKKLILFFKQASINTDFVEELCKRSGPTVKTIMKKEPISLENSCLLQVLITSYEKSFLNKVVNIETNLNALQFVTNLLDCNPSWLHYQENKHCGCLFEISRLGINIIHNCVKVHERRNKEFTSMDQYNDFFKYSVKVLHIINSKYFDIINKFPVDSEYKFIIKTLFNIKDNFNLSEHDDETLRELIIQDDVPNIITSFDAIPIWK